MDGLDPHGREVRGRNPQVAPDEPSDRRDEGGRVEAVLAREEGPAGAVGERVLESDRKSVV